MATPGPRSGQNVNSDGATTRFRLAAGYGRERTATRCRLFLTKTEENLTQRRQAAKRPPKH
jgi:hypothetical protein